MEGEWKAETRRLSIRTRERKRFEGAGEEIEEEEEPMSPAARLFGQDGFNCFVVMVMGVGKPLDVGVIKSGLQNTLARHPRFCSIPVFEESSSKKPRWVAAEVSVEDHIVVPNLDPGGISRSPDQTVEDYVASLTSAPMDASRPLWELHILNFPVSNAAAVAVLRLHHSLGDGISLMSLLLACTRKASDPASLPDLPRRPARPPPAGSRTVGILAIFLLLRAFLILAWNTLVDVLFFVATALFFRDTPTPLVGSEGVENRPKRIVHRTVSLRDIKAIKNAMHCTVNDVLVGVTSAGLSRYLNRRYCQTAHEDGKKVQFPSKIRLRSTLLVNIRPAPGIHALSELMEGRDGGTKWGNLLGYLIMPIPIVNYVDPLDYVRQGKVIADRKKNSLEAIFTYKSADLIVKLFGIKAAAFLCHRVLKNTTFSLSNMNGPVEEIAFFDHPLVFLAPTVYGHPQALTLHFQSYMNAMEIVVAVDDTKIENPHQLLDDLVESLQLIKAEIKHAE
ncbi:wax ester synthase/diacylglycerol acyltransferase 11-like [Curcuma longa]|uniref:wax ester synthase/diacylglycerol acyltransferase 11-like n=1 Tax=Curcuma longa TaxID=136217 RepID=UPI003D9E985E